MTLDQLRRLIVDSHPIDDFSRQQFMTWALWIMGNRKR